MKKIATVALSGGKDSTAAVLLLKEKGYEVRAVTMLMGIEGEEERLEKIHVLVDKLEVRLYIADLRAIFQKEIAEYFSGSYAAGFTPNPCVKCNRIIKFDLLMKQALELTGGEIYATGHYADLVDMDGKRFLTEPADRMKSQIYFLCMVEPEKFKNVVFPISHLTVDEVRKKVAGYPLANIKESQDVCFLQDKKLIDYLKKHLRDEYFQPGNFLDVEGNVIGRHKGGVYFTIGQRRGTGFSSDRKLYVINKDMKAHTVTLGDEKYLYSDTLSVINPVYWKEIHKGERYKVKIRYLTPFSEVEIIEASEKCIKAQFLKPEKSVTPGQIGAFYDGDVIIAGGVIETKV